MTFDQLMQHAKDITDKAADMKEMELTQSVGTSGRGVPDLNSIRKSYEFIESLLEPFSRMPNPAGYDPLIADINAAMGMLNTGSVASTSLNNDVRFENLHLDKMTTDGGYLQGWTGEAAMAFKANFIDTFKSIAGNQFQMMSTLKGALQAQREMWLRARDDIDKIAENTKNALDNAGGCGKNQWSFVFSVVSAVTAVTGVAVATAATGGVAFLPAIGAAVSVESAVVAGTAAAGSGDSVDTIINSMKQAIDTLTKHIQDVEAQQIAQPIRALTDAANQNKNLLVAARPNLAGMSDRDLTGRGGMGKAD